MLRGEEDLLVAGHGVFERAHAGFAAHHERRHHVRKDDDVPDGHHRQAFGIGFFLRSKHVLSAGIVTRLPWTVFGRNGRQSCDCRL